MKRIGKRADKPGETSSTAVRQQGCDAAGKLWLERALETVTALETDTKHVEVILEADEEISRLRQGAIDTLKAVCDVLLAGFRQS
jgi:DNA polymerase phi